MIPRLLSLMGRGGFSFQDPFTTQEALLRYVLNVLHGVCLYGFVFFPLFVTVSGFLVCFIGALFRWAFS